ncbi:hypothetical protein ACOSQ2_013535 [Xanthoceras sorbifolium]
MLWLYSLFKELRVKLDGSPILWCDNMSTGIHAQNLVKGVIEQVYRSKTSLEFWQKLERLYSQQSMARIFQLKQQLQSIKKGTLSISEFMLKVQSIGDELLAAGQAVCDSDLILSVISGVGHEYDLVVVMISHQQKTMSLSDLQYVLMLREQRIEQLNVVSSFDSFQPSAHYASHQNDRKPQRGGQTNGNQGRGNEGRGRNGSRGRGKSGQQRLCCQVSYPNSLKIITQLLNFMTISL